MKKRPDKPIILNYQRPLRDPLEPWISPLALVLILGSVGISLLVMPLFFGRSYLEFIYPGFALVAATMWVWDVEFRR